MEEWKKILHFTNFMLWEKQTNKQTTAPTIMGSLAHDGNLMASEDNPDISNHSDDQQEHPEVNDF